MDSGQESPLRFDQTRIAGESATARPSGGDGIPGRIGPYRILRRLGGGGMGAIYLAEQESVGRQVALKVLPPGFLEGTEAFDRFQREVQVLGKLSHPHICPVLEAGRDGDTQYYAMEHVRGMDLAKVIRTQRIDPARATEVAVQVLRALQFAHERGVVHRDVKPHNIMVARGTKPREGSTGGAGSSRISLVKRIFGGEAKEAARAADSAHRLAPAEEGMPGPEWTDRAVLIDFGLARDDAKRSAKLTMTGAVVGTPAYMAPEQARGGTSEIGPASDLYAMGAVLYEMLALRPPFEGETLAAVLHDVVEKDPRPLRALNPLLDRDLETIVTKAMDKVPARRYASAGEFAADLERWSAGEPILARPASLAYRLRKVVARNRLASAAAAVTLAVGAGALWSAFAPGTLRIESDPAGAEIWLDGSRRGVTPLALRASPGERRLELKLEGYEPERDFPIVKSSQEARVTRTLRHEKGYLTLTSVPGEVRLDLESGGKRVTTASPSIELPLDTGHWEGWARASNCFPRRVSFDLTNGEKRASHLTLNEMKMWQFTAPNGSWQIAIGEATGDAMPDLVIGHDYPLRMSAVRGVDGAVLWTVGLPEQRAAARGAFAVADFDGDVVDDILWVSGPGRALIYDVRTGGLKTARSWPFEHQVMTCADADGDGLTDLGGWAGGSYGVVSGRTGAVLWRKETPGTVTTLRRARMGKQAVPALLVNAEGYGVTAVALHDGAVLWSAPGKVHGASCAADFTGDGVDDAGVPSADSCYRVLSGTDGSEVWSGEFEGMGYRGEDVAGDLDGDGCADVVRGGADCHRVYAISGPTGAVLSSFELQTAWSSAAIADLDGDDLPEFIIGVDSATLALNPRTGSVVWKYDDGRSGTIHSLLADFDGDGRQDVASLGGDAVTVIRAVDRPVLWSQPAGGYNVCDLAPAGDPPRWAFAPGYPLLLLNLRDGRIEARGRAGFGDWAAPRLGPGGTDAIVHHERRIFRVRVPGLEAETAIEAQTDVRPAVLECTGDGVLDLLVSPKGASPALELYDGASLRRLWTTPLLRVGYGAPAVVGGRLWVPVEEGVRTVDPSDGAGGALWTLDGPAASVRKLDDDAVTATRSGDVVRGRLSPDRAAVETVWRVATGLSLCPDTPRTWGHWVALLSTDGVALLLDGRTGQARWRTAPLGRVDGGPSLCDLDGDGLPEVAVCTCRGWALVLAGADGSLLLRHKQGSEFGAGEGVWCDADADGTPELLVLGRTGFASALKVPRAFGRTVCWPSNWERTIRDGEAPTREAEARRRGQGFLDRGDAEGLFALAESTPTPWVCWQAAVAARRAGDARATLRWCDEARRLGVRRLDVDLARAACEPVERRVPAAVEALSAAPADQLEQSAPDDQERAFWVAASEDAARAAVRSGRPECALLILAIAGRWDEAESVFRNAAAADRGRLLLARAAAAVRAERWADAAESYRLADEVASSREEARRRLSALQSQCREALDRARGCCAAGRLDDAIRLYEKALRLQPEDAERWNEAAWTLSTAPGVTAAQGRVACAWAKAAVETHRRAFPGEGSTLSLYLDTLAAAHFAAGEFEDAVRVEREALALPVPERFLRDMKDALEKYEKAAR